MAQAGAKLFSSNDGGESGARVKRNRRSYIWRHGVFGYGGFLFVWLTLFDSYKKGYIHLPPFRVILPGLIFTLIVCLACGYWIGTGMSKRHAAD